MLKKLMIATAATALLAGGAYSQAPAPQSTSPAAMKAQFVEHQAADQMLASKFKGTDVLGPNNEKIGDVTDILFEKDQKVLAYVIGVGGFLGIGTKDVALAPASFQIQPATDKENMKLKLSMTKDELKSAPEFKPLKTTSGSPTTGQAPRDRAPGTPPVQR